MKKLVGMGIALVVLSALAGCSGGGGAESLMNEQIKTMNELSGVLEGIKDDASADAAVPKLEKLALQIKELDKKGKDIKVSADEKKKLEEKFKGQLEEAVKRLMAASVGAGMKAPAKAKQIQAAMEKAK
jgi:hypothetical protein